MSLLVCAECTTRYAVGLSACPHCRSLYYFEGGAEMPKISKHAGPTVEANLEATRLAQAQQAQPYPVAVSSDVGPQPGQAGDADAAHEHERAQSSSPGAGVGTPGPEEPLAEGAGDIRATPREPVSEDRTDTSVDADRGSEPEFVPVSEVEGDEPRPSSP